MKHINTAACETQVNRRLISRAAPSLLMVLHCFLNVCPLAIWGFRKRLFFKAGVQESCQCDKTNCSFVVDFAHRL